MIIWLASYPKSGNTLLRSMLSAYLFSNDGIFNFKLLPKIKQFPYNDILERLGIKSEEFNEIIKNSIRGQELFNKKNTVGFLKTHNMLFNYEKKYPFTNLENTLGVVYIVRDPRNVALSYSRHLDINIEEAVKFITTGKALKNDIMGNWSENYQSWKAFIKHNKYLLIKYEDFIAHREETFLKILKFIYSLRNINFSIDTNKLKNVIETTSLDNLKKLEQKDTFNESAKDSSGNKINFFDKGGKRNWSKELSQDMKVQLEKALNKEMIELGYL
jgi:hypothetical protein